MSSRVIIACDANVDVGSVSDAVTGLDVKSAYAQPRSANRNCTDRPPVYGKAVPSCPGGVNLDLSSPSVYPPSQYPHGPVFAQAVGQPGSVQELEASTGLGMAFQAASQFARSGGSCQPPSCGALNRVSPYPPAPLGPSPAASGGLGGNPFVRAACCDSNSCPPDQCTKLCCNPNPPRGQVCGYCMNSGVGGALRSGNGKSWLSSPWLWVVLLALLVGAGAFVYMRRR